jgi:hypothetical protein
MYTNILTYSGPDDDCPDHGPYEDDDCPKC